MKRALSWLLVLVMVFSMVPMAAFADTAAVWTDAGSYTVVGGNYYEFAPTAAGKYTVTTSDGVLFTVDNGMGFVLGSDLETFSTEMAGDGGSIGITPNADTVITITKADAKPAISWVIYENMIDPTYFSFSACLTLGEAEEAIDQNYLICLSSPFNISGMLNAKYADDATGTYIDYSAALAAYIANAHTIGNDLYTYNTPDMRQMLEHLSIANDWVGRGFITSTDDFIVKAYESHKNLVTETVDGYEFVLCQDCGVLISTTQPGYSSDNPIIVDITWNEDKTVGTGSVTIEGPYGRIYGVKAEDAELYINDELVEYFVNDAGYAIFDLWTDEEATVTFEIKLVKPAPEVTVAGPFKMYMEQGNLDKTLYVTGAMSGYYGATSENAAEGADFYTETSAEGVRIYFMDGTTKKYVEIIPSGTYRNVKFNTEPSIYYTYDAENQTYVTSVEGEDYYLGTYGTYNTLSASKFSYISTSFPAHLGNPVVEPEQPDVPDVPVIPETLAEQIAEANKLANKEHLPYESTITGTITDEPLLSSYNADQYKFTVSDGTNSLLCYFVPVTGGTPAMGDTVTVTGYLTAHNGTAQFDSTAAAVVTKATEPEEPDVPDVPTDNAVISFADIANRTELTTEKQVWEQNGITVTNLKADSTTNVADYVNPARFYKGSSVSVAYPGMTKVVFTCNTYKASYATDLEKSLADLGTVTVDGNVVTLELAAAMDEITFALTSGQVRMDQIEVFTGTASEPADPIPGESAENPIDLTSDLLYEGDFSATVTIPAGATYHFCAYRVGGMTMSINGTEIGTCVTDGMMFPYNWAINNTGANDVEFVITVGYPVGDQMNPEVIESLSYSSFDVSLEEGDDGYYYTYIAEGDGQVTFYFNSITEGVEGDIAVTNMNTGAQRTLLADGVDNWGLELTVDVSEGDELQIHVVVPPDASWNVPAADVNWFGNFTAKPGSESNPIFIEDENWDTTAVIESTAEVPAGETVYFVGRVGNTTLDLTGENLVVTVDGVELTAENGVYNYVVPSTGDMWTPNSIVITNNGTEDASVAMNFTYAAGTQQNPAELQMGEDVITLAEGNEGYIYNWIATEDGELTVAVSGNSWQYGITNFGADRDDWSDDVYGDRHYSTDDPLVDSETITVKQGDIIEVSVGTYDAEMWWAAPAGTVTVNASFAPAGGCKHEGLVHMEAVEPGCHYTGNVEHWYCNDCESVWTDEALTQISNHMSVILPATGEVEATYVAPVEPGCYTEGNIEHWFCEKCEQFWTDEALTKLTNSLSVKLGPVHANVSHFEAVEPGCHYNGNLEYWYCNDCQSFFLDELCRFNTNRFSVIQPATGESEAIHVEAVAPTCNAEGNIEYWYCEECLQVWVDEALTQISNMLSVRLPMAEHAKLTHMDAVEPGCHYDGNIEYWVCYDCEQVWQDEALTQLTNIKNVVLPATHNPEAIHVEAKAPTCAEEGNVEYWYCEECEQVWTDAALTQLSNFKNVQIAMVDHTLLVHMDAVEPGCHYDGNIEHWTCYACEKVWTDEALTQLTNIKNVVLPATGEPEAIHVEAKDPTCFEEGNVEYWYCEECEQVWTDAALTQLSNRMNVKLGALEHANIVHMEAVEPGCHYTGNVEHWYCNDCEQLWIDEALTQISNHMNVIIPATGDDSLLVHMEAVEPGCHDNGHIEHWICYNCEQVWQDAALTQLTNTKNIIVPATGEGEIVHVEAVKPGCENEGNIEHWYCADCDKVWTDEALTQLSNHMSVKLGITHNLVHMDAVAPACHYTGNVEYWYCADCGGHWLDELCRQVTNSKNIVIPAVGGDVIHVPAAEPTCQEGNIEFWFCEECQQVWQNAALTQLTNFKNVMIPATGEHDIDMNNLIWVWGEDKLSAEAFTFCHSCEENVIFYANVVAEAPLTAKHEDYNNIETVYNYFTATVTYKGQTYMNKCVVVDPTCRHVGFTSYYGDVLIGNTVYNFNEYTKDFVMGSPWGKFEQVKKLAHEWKEEGKAGDKDYKKYCVNCNLDYKNVATGDAIMISVIIMVLAAAAVVVLLTKKRRIA